MLKIKKNIYKYYFQQEIIISEQIWNNINNLAYDLYFIYEKEIYIILDDISRNILKKLIFHILKIFVSYYEILWKKYQFFFTQKEKYKNQ